MEEKKSPDALIGCLLGSAVGDALGLPMEGLSRQRQLKIFPDIDSYHFFFGKGMISDDTEHACITAQALIAARQRDALFDERAFTASLSKRLRLWLLMLPAATGYATLRAILKLWLGFKRSGVYSAGNGPAMRSPIIGVLLCDDPDKMKSLVYLSTIVTHTDPKAYDGALAVALAAAMASKHIDDPREYLSRLDGLIDNHDFKKMIKTAAESAGQSTEDFAAAMGLGSAVSGYIYHTVLMVLHTWFRHPADYKTAITAAIRCGGDTDTVAAILGGIIGARVGKAGIPDEYIQSLYEWPVTPGWIERLGIALSETAGPSSPPEFSYIGKFIRNIAFIAIVLFHGFRRLFPPY
ncbi:ADP-ribosylglycohydrolase family protein [Candidatus Magnetominusculus xianensis]|uniref:ADP-ribosylation/crystallin J1 n=1 Tax=Candidatus Magnetominusculus xianensis TaxID=1748249 RepID=A0ABR5SAV9_9BACT|nr:ADP-ribosylglycohydrolase family protein [Candidatus Magnetominusculus xianensis]KWT74918.1 ADP-ribosylation/crystallin J1 [Candidatus Magnetominusculus xianensis]